MAEPRPPAAWLAQPDGDVALELTYTGKLSGQHCWLAVAPKGLMVGPSHTLHVDLPPRTTMRVLVRREDDALPLDWSDDE